MPQRETAIDVLNTAIEKIVYKTVPDVIVSPYLMVGATDSRYYQGYSDAVVNLFF